MTHLQNVIGIWVNVHMAFVLYPKGPKAYLSLIRTPAKSAFQTGQVGAILLADALVVRSFSLFTSHITTICIHKVYRTFVVWGYQTYIIVLPCMTFVATFSEFQTLVSQRWIIIVFLVSGVAFVRLEHTINVEASIFSKTVTQWTVAFLLSSFATTIYSTGEADNISVV